MSKYMINLDDGSIAFRNQYTDAQINMKPVPDKVVEMIVGGELKISEVVNAINARLRERGEFDDIEKYLEERAKLNIHKIKYDLEEKKTELRDRSDEEVSADDIIKMRGKAKKIGHAAKIDEMNAAIDATIDRAIAGK